MKEVCNIWATLTRVQDTCWLNGINSRQKPQVFQLYQICMRIFNDTLKSWETTCCKAIKIVIYGSIIQATPAMSTSHISILPLMSKWFFIPNIFSLYFFVFQPRLCRKRLTWSNGYLDVIFRALDIFSIIFATVYVEAWAPYCLLRLCTCISWGANIFQTTKKNQLKWSTFFWLSN